MRDWFRRLMMGRYGVDQLTWVLLALSLVISLCGSIFQIKGLKNGRANRPSREERRKYKVFICPTCKQKLRVPRGKGKISISCPKCGTSFIKKT